MCLKKDFQKRNQGNGRGKVGPVLSQMDAGQDQFLDSLAGLKRLPRKLLPPGGGFWIALWPWGPDNNCNERYSRPEYAKRSLSFYRAKENGLP